MCVLSHFSRGWLFTTLWTAARHAPLSMGFFRQENSPSPHQLPCSCSPLGLKPHTPIGSSLPLCWNYRHHLTWGPCHLHPYLRLLPHHSYLPIVPSSPRSGAPLPSPTHSSPPLNNLNPKHSIAEGRLRRTPPSTDFFSPFSSGSSLLQISQASSPWTPLLNPVAASPPPTLSFSFPSLGITWNAPLTSSPCMSSLLALHP